MNSSDALAEKLKTFVGNAWRRLCGLPSTTVVVTDKDLSDARTESGKEVRTVFSKKGADSQVNLIKTASEAGTRALASSELHKIYQLSRTRKVAAAFNSAVYIVRKDGGIDILRGGTIHV